MKLLCIIRVFSIKYAIIYISYHYYYKETAAVCSAVRPPASLSCLMHKD